MLPDTPHDAYSLLPDVTFGIRPPAVDRHVSHALPVGSAGPARHYGGLPDTRLGPDALQGIRSPVSGMFPPASRPLGQGTSMMLPPAPPHAPHNLAVRRTMSHSVTVGMLPTEIIDVPPRPASWKRVPVGAEPDLFAGVATGPVLSTVEEAPADRRFG